MLWSNSPKGSDKVQHELMKHGVWNPSMWWEVQPGCDGSYNHTYHQYSSASWRQAPWSGGWSGLLVVLLVLDDDWSRWTEKSEPGLKPAGLIGQEPERAGVALRRQVSRWMSWSLLSLSLSEGKWNISSNSLQRHCWETYLIFGQSFDARSHAWHHLDERKKATNRGSRTANYKPSKCHWRQFISHITAVNLLEWACVADPPAAGLGGYIGP